MDDPFKRGIYAYLGFTVSLWLIAYAMKLNGSAVLRNPSWILISKLKYAFTFGLCLTAILIIIGWILSQIEYKQSQKKQKIEELKNQLILEKNHELRLRYEEELKLKKQIEGEVREKRRQESLKINEENKLSKMRSQSTEDAAQSSLDSFLN